MTTSYRPKLDVTTVLSSIDTSYYMSLVWILRWMIELRCLDIRLEVAMVSSYMCMPREGHLNAIFHILSHLRKHHNTEMVFDPSDPVIDESKFRRQD